MLQKFYGMVSLNEETMFMPQHRGVRAPVRVDENIAKRIINELESVQPDAFSCIETISAEWDNNKLVINTTYNPRTKCKPNLYTKARPIKTGVCLEKMCTGKCVDKFMREVIAKNILPDLYDDKQR